MSFACIIVSRSAATRAMSALVVWPVDVSVTFRTPVKFEHFDSC